MRYIFTGGKGGVGKTVAAAGLAYHYASQGENVLVASLNPVHSLSSLFGQSLSGGKVIEVKGAKNVHAVEVETTEVVERYRNSIRGRVKEFLKWADIPLDAKPFIEMAEVKKDPLMADLISMNERFEKAKGVLVDPERTAFFFVTLPLALPIAVVRRFIGMVQKFNIPIGGVIVNEVLRPEIALQDGAGEYLANKYHEQIAYMKVLYRDLGPLVRSYIPLYPSEVTGVDMVRRVSEDMMTYTPPFAAELTGAA